MHETESISTLAVAICCGVAAAVLGTAAIVFLARQVFIKRTMSNYEFLNHPIEKHSPKQHRHHQHYHHKSHRHHQYP